MTVGANVEEVQMEDLLFSDSRGSKMVYKEGTENTFVYEGRTYEVFLQPSGSTEWSTQPIPLNAGETSTVLIHVDGEHELYYSIEITRLEQTQITRQPQDVIVEEGETARFSVAATGENLTYQWQQSSDDGSSWADIAGANASTYSIPNAATEMSGYWFRCVVSGDGGNAISDPAVLTVKHALVETEAKEPTCTEPGNVYGWTCDTCGKHFNDENGTTEIEESKWIIPATGHSYGDDGHCMACGAVDSDFTPAIIAGTNATWQKGSEDGLSFTSNAAFADFLKVQVDGKDVDASNYTVKEGSTIVTLKASYLETLSVGEHTLAIVSDTGTAQTEFTVVAAEKQVVDDESADDKAANYGDKGSLAKTGDGSVLPIAILSILAVASIATGVFALRRSRI